MLIGALDNSTGVLIGYANGGAGVLMSALDNSTGMLIGSVANDTGVFIGSLDNGPLGKPGTSFSLSCLQNGL